MLRELDISRPLLISTERWRELELPVPRRFHGVRPHAEVAGVRAALEAIRDADGLVALGPAGLACVTPRRAPRRAARGGRGRDGPSLVGLGPPPAQIPACGTTALGSSLE